jgi:hypothetical protein
MGRLEEAMARDRLALSGPVGTHGAVVRQALWLIAEGKLEVAKARLRKVLSDMRGSAAHEVKRSVEGPELVPRAKELLCQVLHKLGSTDPQDQAEEAALRAELQEEEARRGEALREVRALTERTTAEEEQEEDEWVWGSGAAGRAGPRCHKKKKKPRRGKKGVRTRTTAARGAAIDAADAADALPALEGGEAQVADVLAPLMEDMSLQPSAEKKKEEEEEEDDCCPICLTPFDGDERGDEGGVGVLSCGHEFHVTCVDAWVSMCVVKGLDVTCPSCRAPVNR